MSQAMRMLLAEGHVSRQQLDRATFLQATRGGTIDSHLIAAAAISSDQLVRFLVRRFPVAHWPRKRFENLAQHVLDSISPRLAATLRILPLARSGNTLVLGLTDPSRHHAIHEAAHYSGTVVQPVVISHDDMNWALSTYYPAVTDTRIGEEVPVPLTQRVTREFEAVNGGPLQEQARAIPLVNRPPAPGPVRAASAPARSPAAAPARAAAPGSASAGVVTREAVVLRGTPLPPPPESKPPEAVQTSRLRPERRSRPSRPFVVADPIRTIGPAVEPSRFEPTTVVEPETIIEPKKVIEPERTRDPVPDYDSWTPPRAKGSSRPARRRASHPLSRPRKSRDAPGPADARPSPAPTRETARERPAASQAEEEQPPRARTEGELIAAIDKSRSRDDIIALGLEYMQRFAERAVFFVVKSTEIRGFEIRGPLTSREAIRSFWIPATSASTLQKVVSERQIHFGPLGFEPADSVLAAALGGRPERAMIVPVVIRERVVGLLYADRLEIESPPWSRLQRLGDVVAENLGQLIKGGNRS